MTGYLLLAIGILIGIFNTWLITSARQRHLSDKYADAQVIIEELKGVIVTKDELIDELSYTVEQQDKERYLGRDGF